MAHIKIVELEHITIDAALETVTRPDGYRLENRGVKGWAAISPTNAVVAEGLPGRREAEYSADADKPRQIA